MKGYILIFDIVSLNWIMHERIIILKCLTNFLLNDYQRTTVWKSERSYEKSILNVNCKTLLSKKLRMNKKEVPSYVMQFKWNKKSKQ